MRRVKKVHFPDRNRNSVVNQVPVVGQANVIGTPGKIGVEGYLGSFKDCIREWGGYTVEEKHSAIVFAALDGAHELTFCQTCELFRHKILLFILLSLPNGEPYDCDISIRRALNLTNLVGLRHSDHG